MEEYKLIVYIKEKIEMTTTGDKRTVNNQYKRLVSCDIKSLRKEFPTAERTSDMRLEMYVGEELVRNGNTTKGFIENKDGTIQVSAKFVHQMNKILKLVNSTGHKDIIFPKSVKRELLEIEEAIR